MTKKPRSPLTQDCCLPGWTLGQSHTGVVPEWQKAQPKNHLAHSNHPPPCSALSPGRISHLLALRGVMLKGGPGRPRAFGNRSTHICSFPWGGRHDPALSPPFLLNQDLPTTCSALDTWSTGQRRLRPAWRGSASSRGGAFSGTTGPTTGLSPPPTGRDLGSA